MNNKTPLPIRSLLFLPATKLDKWQNAVSSGADSICIDLEDSVGLDNKASARKDVVAFLKEKKSFPIVLCVRINPISALTGLRDLMALLESGNIPGALIIPKVSDPYEVDLVGNILDEIHSQCTVIPIIETVEGLRKTCAILDHPRCRGAIFGGFDLAQQMGCKSSWDVLASHRSGFIRDAADKNVTLLDSPYFDLQDEEGLIAEATLARAFGYQGKSAIHPKQISPIHDVFTPSQEEIKEAMEIITEFDKQGGQVFQFKGRVIEKPIIESAKQILAQAHHMPKARKE